MDAFAPEKVQLDKWGQASCGGGSEQPTIGPHSPGLTELELELDVIAPVLDEFEELELGELKLLDDELVEDLDDELELLLLLELDDSLLELELLELDELLVELVEDLDELELEELLELDELLFLLELDVLLELEVNIWLDDEEPLELELGLEPELMELELPLELLGMN